MKEELLQLKEDINNYLKKKEKFKKQQIFFNMKVEEKGRERELEIDEDAYEEAHFLFYTFPIIHETATKIKEQNLDYSEKIIKNLLTATLLNEFKNTDSYSLFLDEKYIIDLVEQYYLYVECGYFKLKEQENNLKNLEIQIHNSKTAVLNQPKKAINKVGKITVNLVKPYAEVAKEQFNDAKTITKSLVNKGSKNLIRILKKVEEKTEQK